MSYYNNYIKEQKKWEAAAQLYVLLRANGASHNEALQTSTNCSYQQCIEMINDLRKRARWIKNLEDELTRLYLAILAIKLAQGVGVGIDVGYIERMPTAIAKKKLPEVLFAFAEGDEETAIQVLEDLYEW